MRNSSVIRARILRVFQFGRVEAAGNLHTGFGVLPATDERFQFLAGLAVAAGLYPWIRFQRGTCALYVFIARHGKPVRVVAEIPSRSAMLDMIPPCPRCNCHLRPQTASSLPGTDSSMVYSDWMDAGFPCMEQRRRYPNINPRTLRLINRVFASLCQTCRPKAD